MGYTRSSSSDWGTYSAKTSTKSRAEIFKKREMDPDMNPLDVAMREARDSDLSPESTPIIIACDVTGSMGMTAERIVKTGMKTLFTDILDVTPVKDPAIMTMAIGDATMRDEAPLQVSQFESDLKAAEWLEKVYLEGGGGGNSFESYDLPYYFAAYHTSTDCFEKRNKKGYIFTMGDEEAPTHTTVNSIRNFINSDGDGLQADIPFEDVLEAAGKMYHCFHIVIAEGSHARYRPAEVRASWKKYMPQNMIWLKDISALSETIISTIQVMNGTDKETAAKTWSGSTAIAVADAIKDIDAIAAFDNAKAGIVTL